MAHRLAEFGVSDELAHRMIDEEAERAQLILDHVPARHQEAATQLLEHPPGVIELSIMNFIGQLIGTHMLAVGTGGAVVCPILAILGWLLSRPRRGRRCPICGQRS